MNINESTRVHDGLISINGQRHKYTSYTNYLQHLRSWDVYVVIYDRNNGFIVDTFSRTIDAVTEAPYIVDAHKAAIREYKADNNITPTRKRA